MLNEKEVCSLGLGISCEVLTTQDLILRPLQKSDAPDIAKLANNINVASMLASMPFPYHDSDAQEFVEQFSNPSDDSADYAITHLDTGAVMGVASIRNSGELHDLPDLGYWLGEEYWGKGYATQAARALVDVFFKVGSQDELIFSVMSINTASLRVIEKCGAQFWKKDSIYSEIFKEEREFEHYRITRESWMGAVST